MEENEKRFAQIRPGRKAPGQKTTETKTAYFDFRREVWSAAFSSVCKTLTTDPN